MKRSKRIIFYSGYALLSIALVISLMVQYGCEKLDPQRKLIIRTVSVSSISFESCNITGKIVDLSEQAISEHGFCFAITSNPTISDRRVEMGSVAKAQSFTSTIQALNPSTKYYVKAFATNSVGTVYGEQMQFTTLVEPATLPTVTTSTISPGEDQATGGGNVTDTGGAEVTSKGVCWATIPQPTISGKKTIDGTGTGAFVSSITGLTCETKYYLRAYATSAVGTAYSEEVTFSTKSCPVGDLPAASFSHSPSSVLEGDTINFTDLSTNSPTSWDWAFGDGFTSTFQHPSHSYSVEGEYSVSLTVANNYGSDTETRTISVIAMTAAVTDYDGNVYPTVQIGEQVWMKENLKVTHYPDGTEIPCGEDVSSWDSIGTTDKIYSYYNDDILNGDIYGALYSWSGAMNGAESSDAVPSGVQGVCPDGWHLPGDEEWKQLEIFLGMDRASADNSVNRGTDEGGKLKSTGVEWASPNSGATNESGFTALPGGNFWKGSFNALGEDGLFWTTTEDGDEEAYFRFLGNEFSTISRSSPTKILGCSVRCVKD